MERDIVWLSHGGPGSGRYPKGSGKKYFKKAHINKYDNGITKKVKNDFNNMNDYEFKNKYHVSKKRYEKRIKKYGDPYKKTAIYKFGKTYNNINNRKRNLIDKRLSEIKNKKYKDLEKDIKESEEFIKEYWKVNGRLLEMVITDNGVISYRNVNPKERKIKTL